MDLASPSPGGLLGWLAVRPVTDCGEVLSWVSPAHPGYPYPEAAGLWLSCAAQLPVPQAHVARVTAALCGALVEGPVGRGASRYIFDTAMALDGVLAHEPGAVAHVQDTVAWLAHAVDQRLACTPAAPTRWSTGWSCHMLKLVGALTRTGLATAARLDTLAAPILACEHDGRFALSPDDDRSYLHASCYALEGVAMLISHHRRPLHAVLRRGTDRLRDLQRSDGTLPAWDGAPDETGGPSAPSDVLAQAVRLWLLADADHYAPQIATALSALAGRQTADGAIVYGDEAPFATDANTWCTIFTAQATAWATEGVPEVPWIV